MVVLLDLMPSSLARRSLLLGGFHLLLTLALELTCLGEVRRLRATGAGRALYASAWVKNAVNDLVLESFTYYGTIRFLCHPEAASFQDQLLAAAGIVAIEAVLYFLIHKAYHEAKGLYWIHSYHHKFNAIILPSTAMAVSVAEYVTAYLFPVVVGIWIMRADETAAFLCGLTIGFSNLLIHTPWMERHHHPWMFVSTSDHLAHHRRKRGNYGAPILHMDRIIAWLFQKSSKVE